MLRSLLRSSPAALLALAAPASAAPKLHSFASAPEVSLSARVTVPLVDCADGTLRPCVWVAWGEGAEQRMLLALEVGADEVHLNDAAVGAVGATLKGAEDAPLRTAQVAKLMIGGMVLSDVVVSNTPALKASAAAPGDRSGPLGAPRGYIGLGALNGVAWAILPSTGEVVFAPAAEGAALVSGLGSTPLPVFKTLPGALKTPQGEVDNDEGRLGTLVQIDGKDVPLTFSTHVARTQVERELLPAGPTAAYGDRRLQPVALGLGGTSTTAVVEHRNSLPVLRQFQKNEVDTITRGVLGADVLGALDLAYDPTAKVLGAKAAPTREAAAPQAAALAVAEAALAKAQQAPAAEGAPAPAADAPKGSAAAWSAVAKARRDAGDLKGAVQAHQAAAQLDPKGCATHMALGEALLAAGEPAAAEQSLQTASTLWHAWGDLAVEVRGELKKALDHAQKDGVPFHFNAEEFGFVQVANVRAEDVRKGAPPPRLPAEGAEVIAQSSACFVADGLLAAAQLAHGRAGGPEGLYASRLDLDALLPLAAGNALLTAKNHAGAAAAYRQAVLRDHAQRARPAQHLLGLAQAAAAAGDAAGASALAAEAAARAPEDALIGLRWAELAIAAKSTDALAAARAHALARTDLIAPQLAYLRLAEAGGASAEIDAARASLRAALAQLQPKGLLDPADAALAHAALGEVDKAKAAAAAALAAAPGDARSQVAHAAAAQAAGEASAVEMANRAAARLDPFHPALVR
ncbi:MAG: hypothetical protein RL071_2846 [Pseudomonadota bacterium]